MVLDHPSQLPQGHETFMQTQSCSLNSDMSNIMQERISITTQAFLQMGNHSGDFNFGYISNHI